MTTQIHDTHLDISALFDSSTTQAKDFVPQCMDPYTVIFGKARCLLSWLSGCMRLLTILLVLGKYSYDAALAADDNRPMHDTDEVIESYAGSKGFYIIPLDHKEH